MDNKQKEPHLDKLVGELADQLRAGKPLTGKDGVFTPLFKRVIEASLEAEMDTHLRAQDPSRSNRRNGRSTKQVQSSAGGFEVFTPRDRDASFTPQSLP